MKLVEKVPVRVLTSWPCPPECGCGKRHRGVTTEEELPEEWQIALWFLFAGAFALTLIFLFSLIGL